MNNMRNKILSLLVLLLTVTTGAWADELSESFTTNHEVSVYTGEHFKITVGDVGSGKGFYLAENKYATIEALNGEIITKVELTKGYYYINNFYCEVGTTNISGDVATVSGVNNTSLTFTASGALQIKAVKVYYTAPEPDIEVTTNDTKTEASFQMPQYDVTATYTIKRDISVDVTATMGDGTDGVRYRVKQEGGFWHPVDITSQAQLLALLNVTDQIENTNLVIGTDYEFRFYAVDDEGQPTGEGMNLGSFQFAPGRYAVRCFAKEGSNYVGEAALSNVFTLFQGYELEIPAGEYATYYMNEPLSVDESTPEGQLYTISSVNLENATATATELSVAEANTPLLVKNNADETKRILLVPSVETADEVTVAPEFKGTLVDKTFTDEDMHDADHYVCNGRAFVWVMDAGVIAPNRAWLEIEKEEVESARTLQIVFGDATGVNDVIGAEDGNDGWYDLNGRKLRKAPAQKGVFIQNGNKVLVK